MTVLLPVSFFAYLTVRRVRWVLALPVSVYLMLAMANLPVRPKMMHFALIVIFLSLALFIRLGERPLRWGFLLAVCGALSLVRPELIYVAAAVAAWCLYLAIADRRARGELIASAMAGGFVIAALYWQFGVPLFGERSVFALAWHFGINYMSWQGAGGATAFTGDYWAIYRTVFGDAQSIPAAFLANPAAFLHHMVTNLMHLPVVLGGNYLFHYDILLPRYRAATLVEGALLAAALVLAVAPYWRRVGTPARGIAGLLVGGRRLLAECPEVLLLLLLAAPYAVMMIVLYPRYHYATMIGTILLAIALVAFARRPASGSNAWMTDKRLLFALPLLLAVVPSLGSVGVVLNEPYGEKTVGPRPALVEALFLRGLHLSQPVRVFEASDPGISPYVAPNFRSVSEMDKERGLQDFLSARQISIVLEDDRLRAYARYSADAEWARFRAAPQAFGFTAKPIPGADAVAYVRAELLK
jgi:hypothetical protein